MVYIINGKVCLIMASSSNFDLKSKLEVSFKNTTTLDPLCRTIATEIESGSIKLCAFVEMLGSYMTDQNVFIREKGVTTLSSVLSYLSKDYLTESELHFIKMFYCDRIKDHYSIISSVLNGILAIVNMTHLPQDAPSFLLKIIFEHVQCQSQLLPDRRNIYLIFKNLIENKPDNLRSMGPDLVYGIINSVDGERDPSNLMLLFDMLPHFIKKFPLGHLTEEMFEVMACYFPVDFNPSGKENLNITRNDLAEKLAPCLYAVPEFAEYCIPLIIDKLYSTLKVAKLDSLRLLRDSVQAFGLSKVQSHLPELWTSIKKEIIPGEDVELRDAALEAIVSLVRVISINETICKDFIHKTIIDDLKSLLCDITQIHSHKPPEKTLEAIASVSKATCVEIMRYVLPLCMYRYDMLSKSNDKIFAIETLNNFLKICSNQKAHIEDIPELRDMWMQIPGIYLLALLAENTEVKNKLFLGLVTLKADLDFIQRDALYNTICNEIETGSNEIQIICHTTILEFATLYLQEILSLVKEKLLLNPDKKVEIGLLKRRIQALLAIAKIYELGCVILPKIVAMLDNNVNTDICATILMNIQKLIVSKKSNFNIHHFLYKECHIIDKLISYETSIVEHKTLISNICQSIIRNLSIEEQRMIVKKHAVILNTGISEIDAVIMNLLIPMRQNVHLNINNDTIENLYNLAISHNLDVRQTTCKFLSVLLNKMEAADLDAVVPYLEDKINNNLKTDINIVLKQHTVDLQIWITKALIMNGCNKSQDILENLTHLLNHNQIGRYVGEQYQILVSEHGDALIKENFCNIKIFYKQRIFGYLLQQNVNYTCSLRQNYFIALIHLLEQMPEELLFLYLAELVPLLTETLSLDDEHLVLRSLRFFKLLLDTKHDIFSGNMQCIIPRLLHLSTHRTMNVRTMALECLTHYTNYPTILINPYKQVVLDKLGVVIDDCKRLVRKAAVEARTRWFIVGAPGGSNE